MFRSFPSFFYPPSLLPLLLIIFCFFLPTNSSQLLFPPSNPQFQFQSLPTQQNYQRNQIVLLGILFDMTWTSINDTKQFDFFNQLSGEGSYYLAFNQTLEPTSSRIHINTAIYILFDPKYYDKKLALISVPLKKSYNNNTQSWQGTTTCLVEIYNNLKVQRIAFEVPNTKFIINQEYSVLQSELFNFATARRVTLIQAFLPWVMILPCLFMLVSMHFVAVSQINPLKISLLTLYLNLIFLLFVSLLQLYLGVNNINNPQGWLILSGVITFITVIRFVQCFEPVIRRINGIKGYLQFYALIFVYIWCLFSYGATKWFIIVNSLIFLPQIFHNTYEGIKPNFYISYISTIAMSQFYIIYYKGCPENILRISPSLWCCIGVAISLTLQILFLFIQHKRGARFFIPKRCIPGYHNYIEEIEFDLNTRLMVEDCTICLLPLCDEPGTVDDFEGGKNLPMHVENKVVKKIMRTPCNHMFHISCLETWMEQKMECPIDRSKLPPLEM